MMENKIIDHSSLLLEKQRLKTLVQAQEKDIAINFQKVRKKLNPSYLVREAVLDLIPKDIRENKIISFLSSIVLPKSNGSETGESNASTIVNDIFKLAQSAVLAWVMRYVSRLTDETKK